MNNVSLIGRLVKEPEVKYTTGNEPMAVCKFTVAIDDGYGEKKRTNFIPVTVFGKQAENCEKFLGKGRQVGVTGKIQTGSYEKDGRKVYTTDVIASNVEFIGSKESVDNGVKTSQNENYGVVEGEQQGFTALRSDDIPF